MSERATMVSDQKNPKKSLRTPIGGTDGSMLRIAGKAKIPFSKKFWNEFSIFPDNETDLNPSGS
jgi:hypothetical protein